MTEHSQNIWIYFASTVDSSFILSALNTFLFLLFLYLAKMSNNTSIGHTEVLGK